MAFRIGRKHAQHTYPSSRFGAPALLQVGSDLLETPFSVVGEQAPARVDKSAGTLLQVELPGFRRVNGLWVEATAFLDPADPGDAGMSYFVWFKFASLPQYFLTSPADPVGVSVVSIEAPTDPVTQPLQGISLALSALMHLPDQTIDGPPIPLPAVDDLQVGIAGTGSIDFNIDVTTTIMAGEINASIITQMPTVDLVTMP